MEYSSINQLIPLNTGKRHLLYILDYIYNHDKSLSKDQRVALVFKQLSLLPVKQLQKLALPGKLGARIMKDIEELQQDSKYVKRWPDPLRRLAYLKHEWAFIRNLSQKDRNILDDHVSLNYKLDNSQQTKETEQLDDLVSTLILRTDSK